MVLKNHRTSSNPQQRTLGPAAGALHSSEGQKAHSRHSLHTYNSRICRICFQHCQQALSGMNESKTKRCHEERDCSGKLPLFYFVFLALFVQARDSLSHRPQEREARQASTETPFCFLFLVFRRSKKLTKPQAARREARQASTESVTHGRRRKKKKSSRGSPFGSTRCSSLAKQPCAAMQCMRS